MSSRILEFHQFSFKPRNIFNSPLLKPQLALPAEEDDKVDHDAFSLLEPPGLRQVQNICNHCMTPFDGFMWKTDGMPDYVNESALLLSSKRRIEQKHQQEQLP